MKIDVNDVKYIAKLAMLDFTEDEAKLLADEFQSILGHFESIDRIDLSDVHTDLYSEDMKAYLRKDEPAVYEDKKKLFQNVKSMDGTSIKVPKILE